MSFNITHNSLVRYLGRTLCRDLELNEHRDKSKVDGLKQGSISHDFVVHDFSAESTIFGSFFVVK